MKGKWIGLVAACAVLAPVFALSWLSPLTACGATPSFQPLGYLVPGHDVSQASGVSDDGSTVVGTSRESVLEAFRWTEETGMLRLTGTQSWATATSADGSVVVGYKWSSTSSGQAFRWTEEGGTVFLPGLPPPQPRSWAQDVSADGSVVVGHSSTGRDDRGWETHEAWRWTAETGTVGLGDLPGWRFDSEARGVSADGSVVVGQGCTGVPSDGSPAIRWTQETGMVSLGDLPGGRHTVDDLGRAFGVSADGLVVVGYGSTDSGWEAFRWTAATGMVGLGEFPDGHFSSRARAASGDGSIVVGRGTTALGVRAAIWDAAGTMRNLGDVLVNDYGLDLTGWTLSEATDITPDGQVIVGTGLNPAGDTEAWRAVIPRPAEVSLDIKPGSWLNPLSPVSKGLLPAAVCGTDEFDVMTIDTETLLLGREGIDGVAPVRWSYDNVAAPFEGEWCDGHGRHGDGFMDLALKFRTQELVSALGLDLLTGQAVPLVLTGSLLDGTPLTGSDWVWVLSPGDGNMDGLVDGLDYIGWSNHYRTGTAWSEGEFTGDGYVDGLDYVIWSNNYGEEPPGLVPEPGALALLGLGALALLRRRRHKA